MLKEAFHKHPLVGTYRSGQREHFKNGLNIAIKWGLFILNHSLWILDNSFSCLEGCCFALLLIKIAAWLINATSLSGRVDFTLWSLSHFVQVHRQWSSHPHGCPSQDDRWSVCADSHPCCGCPVDWSNHAAFERSLFGTGALATFSSKLSPSLVSQGHPDFGSLEVRVAHFIHFALIPKRIWSNTISIWLLCCDLGRVTTIIEPLTFPSVSLLQSTCVPPFVKVTSLRECQLSHVLLWKPADGRRLGKIGHCTNARVTLWVCRLVGLECQCVGPSFLVSELASREVPIRDICQEWEVRNANTRRSGW